ncbi:MAG: RNA-guided endonuclease TnpB family protein [Cyanobacteria bacterium J06592_8]
MLHKVVKVRIYPAEDQRIQLARMFGCSRWWWNHALNKTIEEYKATGKGLSRTQLNALLPPLKKAEETEWLAECYSQVLQATTLNLTRAFKNFFEKRALFPRFKSKRSKQSIQFPQNVSRVSDNLKIPKVGIVKAKIHRWFEGKIKTVTITLNPAGQYHASILIECECCDLPGTSDKISGVDLGLKHFAIVHDGNQVKKYTHPKILKKHSRNLAKKQKTLARKKLGSNSRQKAKRLVAKVHNRIFNARYDFCHKLSRKLVDENQTLVFENLNVKGMVRNHNLAKAISDSGWGMFTNFCSYKLEQRSGQYVEVDRFFPSSKLCSECFHQVSEMPLDVREWTCPNCGTHHDRDENAGKNLRAEGIRILASGTEVSASGGECKTKLGPKTKFRQSSKKLETPATTTRGVVHTVNPA